MHSAPSISDLKARAKTAVPTKLMSVRLPTELIDRIDTAADRLNAGKAETVSALLSEGLRKFSKTKK